MASSMLGRWEFGFVSTVMNSFQVLQLARSGRRSLALVAGTRLIRTGRQHGVGFQLQIIRCAAHARSIETRGRDQYNDRYSDRSFRNIVLWSALAFSLFGNTGDEEDETKKKEDEIILLLKRSKLSIMRGELDAANGTLHQAIRLAHQSHNTQAIIYTYSLMANLALIQGQLPNAEKLFKAAMSFLLAGGTPEDDNAVIEMSLKLASIYGSQNRHELAEHGFRFCVESLEAKIEQQKDLPVDSLTDEERKDTVLLLGLCLDSRARYLTALNQLEQAGDDYERALHICMQEQGESHPQTLVLMNDLATVLDLQGRHAEALALVKRALALGGETGYPEQHVLLGNMAGILLHKGEVGESARLYHEALILAQAVGDGQAVENIEEGLKELNHRRDQEASKVGGPNSGPQA